MSTNDKVVKRFMEIENLLLLKKLKRLYTSLI